jgi:hypothetical protein
MRLAVYHQFTLFVFSYLEPVETNEAHEMMLGRNGISYEVVSIIIGAPPTLIQMRSLRQAYFRGKNWIARLQGLFDLHDSGLERRHYGTHRYRKLTLSFYNIINQSSGKEAADDWHDRLREHATPYLNIIPHYDQTHLFRTRMVQMKGKKGSAAFSQISSNLRRQWVSGIDLSRPEEIEPQIRSNSSENDSISGDACKWTFGQLRWMRGIPLSDLFEKENNVTSSLFVE